MEKIIGIDPGLATTGIGIVTGSAFKVTGYAYCSIRTPKNMLLPLRLDRIFSEVLSVLQFEKPDLIVLEDIFSLKEYPQSGITLGKVAGVILLAGCRALVPVAEISVREAKQVLTGNGKADKAHLERAVRNQLGAAVPIRPDHASDALALALIGLYRSRPSTIGNMS
ncbi:MAG: crossover junction endodeoxyribonuclease RuvC [Desulfobacterales bacterium]|jgi:crossover junction endodeoxyribonuclease RuvC|nr:crossover junction endodeoxyribonuclease RuvC [Desulfobacterales bacterium]